MYVTPKNRADPFIKQQMYPGVRAKKIMSITKHPVIPWRNIGHEKLLLIFCFTIK